MAYYLTIDIGNSSVKAAAWIDNQLLEPPVWGNLKPYDIEHLCAQANGMFDYAAVCSVASDPHGLLAAAARCSRQLINVDSTTPLPISLDRYTTTRTLGADRIAALTGAQSLYPGTSLLVVDCGTAITYDRLSADGDFLGGNIAPGLGMRLKALHAFTSRLPEAETNPCAPLWGLSTIEAMQSGALRGAVAEIEYYHRLSPTGTQVVLTGGRAQDLMQYLDLKASYEPNLVLIGLKHIIENISDNENK